MPAGQILQQALEDLLFSLSQGYQAQSQGRGAQARSAGIGAALGGAALRRQIQDQQASDDEDRQLKIQQMRQAALRGDQDAALRLREAIGNPVAPTDSVTTTGLPIPVTMDTELPPPPVQYPLGNGKSLSMPVTSAQDAIRMSGMQEDLKQQILNKYKPAPATPPRRLMNTSAGVIDIDNPEGGIIPGTAPVKAPEKVAPQPTIRTAAGIMQWNPSTQKYDIKVGDNPPSAGAPKVPARLPAGEAVKISDLDNALTELATLKGTIPEGTTGTRAAIGAAMPNAVTNALGWGKDAKQKLATINRVKQIIGKALEGGVLRKEDEEKYAKILPTIQDGPELVASKLSDLADAIQRKRLSSIDSYEDAGYDMSRYRSRVPASGERIEQYSPSTKQYRHSLDGGKTWVSGKLPPIG